MTFFDLFPFEANKDIILKSSNAQFEAIMVIRPQILTSSIMKFASK